MKRRNILFALTIILVFQIVFTHPSYAEVKAVKSQVETWKDSISDILPMCNEWQYSDLIHDGFLQSDSGNIYNHYTLLSRTISKITGYIITDDQDNVIEFSWNQSPYEEYRENHSEEMKNINKTKAFYQPGFHYLIENETLIPLFSLREHESLDSQSVERVGTHSSNAKSGDYNYYIISGVPDYDQYISCIPTAIGNMIGYWDSHGYPNLMTGSYTSMITEVAGYMTSIYSNSYIPTAVHNYCHKTGRYPSNFTAINVWNPSFNAYVYQVTIDKPTLVGFKHTSSNPNPYGGNHMTTGVGYLSYYPLSQNFVIVHDGWGHGDYSVLWGTNNDYICTITP